MAKLALPGGTDVAEGALFSVDSLGERPPNVNTSSALEERGSLMREEKRSVKMRDPSIVVQMRSKGAP